MTKNEKRVLFLRCLQRLVRFTERRGIELFEIEGHRTLKRQKELVKAGKSWTLNSKHILKRAKDLGIFKKSRTANGTFKRIVDWNGDSYTCLGEYWESLHPLCRWGGRWKARDAVHFEIK